MGEVFYGSFLVDENFRHVYGGSTLDDNLLVTSTSPSGVSLFATTRNFPIQQRQFPNNQGLRQFPKL